MRVRRFGATVALVAMLAGCGGDSGGSAGPVSSGGGSTGTAPTPTPTAGCSLRDRQDWALAQLREWYLFPDLLATGVDPAAYSTVGDYVDALVAPARAQRKDRYFTYVTSIAEENAYYDSGQTAGFGVRLTYQPDSGSVFVAEAFEGAPALAAGIDRGAEILGIGTTSADIRTTESLLASANGNAFDEALGPSTAGTQRVLRIRDAGGIRDVTVTKADFELDPVSNRYGAKILDDAGRKVGYLNLRTFINTADPALRDAFAQFRAAGVTQVVIDLRYNGGGLVSIAELMGNLLAANRSTGDVFSYTTFRASKSDENETTFFAPQPQSIAPMKLAFIGTGGTASASELVINAFIPYLRENNALIGSNTYGKPVGQIALDRAACDDRLRIIAFATQNSARQGDYFDGLAGVVNASCRADDDITRPLGDPQEASVRLALDYLDGKSCTPIAANSARALQSRVAAPAPARELLTPARPTTPQRETPGLF